MGFLPRVKDVQRTLIVNPFRANVARWFSISANHCQVIEIVKVITDVPDIVGFGETMIDYVAVPHRVTDQSIARVVGSVVSELLFDDTIGAGLQMALLDATGKALGLPAYKIFESEKVRESCPVSWWNMEAPPTVLAEEAKLAVAAGYTSHKIKARPWFDIYAQIHAIDSVTPTNYLIDIDWNGQLLDVERATPVIERLVGIPKIGLFEDPIPRDDVFGQKKLLQICDKPLLTHFFEEWADRQLSARTVDGYVIDGGISRVLRIGTEIDERNMEGFIQLCGTNLTVALSLHLGAVIRGAKHPYVSMTTAFSTDILKEPFKIDQGHIKVPDLPGLGVELDEEVVEKLRINVKYPLELPRRYLRFNLGDGRSKCYQNVEQLWEDTSVRGSMPVQPEYSSLEIIEDDQSQDFASLYRKLEAGPLWK